MKLKINAAPWVPAVVRSIHNDGVNRWYEIFVPDNSSDPFEFFFDLTNKLNTNGAYLVITKFPKEEILSEKPNMFIAEFLKCLGLSRKQRTVSHTNWKDSPVIKLVKSNVAFTSAEVQAEALS